MTQPRTAPLVGLVGAKRAGKDTVGEYLAEDHGYSRLAFADPLRAMAYALDPICTADGSRLSTLVDVLGWERAKDEHPEVRRTLDRLGTEAGRRILGESVWTDRVADRIAAAPHVAIAVTDVRFANEVHLVHRLGGIVALVVRPGLPDQGDHASTRLATAAARDPFGHGMDVVIHNDTTLTHLRADATDLAAAARDNLETACA